MNMKQTREQPWCECVRTNRASNCTSLLLRGQLGWHDGLPRMPAILSALLAAGLVHSTCNVSADGAPIHITKWILLSTHICCVDAHDIHSIISVYQWGGKRQGCEWQSYMQQVWIKVRMFSRLLCCLPKMFLMKTIMVYIICSEQWNILHFIKFIKMMVYRLKVCFSYPIGKKMLFFFFKACI